MRRAAVVILLAALAGPAAGQGMVGRGPDAGDAPWPYPPPVNGGPASPPAPGWVYPAPGWYPAPYGWGYWPPPAWTSAPPNWAPGFWGWRPPLRSGGPPAPKARGYTLPAD